MKNRRVDGIEQDSLPVVSNFSSGLLVWFSLPMHFVTMTVVKVSELGHLLTQPLVVLRMLSASAHHHYQLRNFRCHGYKWWYDQSLPISVASASEWLSVPESLPSIILFVEFYGLLVSGGSDSRVEMYHQCRSSSVITCHWTSIPPMRYTEALSPSASYYYYGRRPLWFSDSTRTLRYFSSYSQTSLSLKIAGFAPKTENGKHFLYIAVFIKRFCIFNAILAFPLSIRVVAFELQLFSRR